MKIQRRTYTLPHDAIFRAGQKKANVTKAITLLGRVQVDAMGRHENIELVDALQIALDKLKEYKTRLLTL